jgi:hypothetical protein
MILGASPLGASPLGAMASSGDVFVNVSDTMSMNDTATPDWVMRIIERIGTADVSSSSLTAFNALSESVGLADALISIFREALADVIGTADTLAASRVAVVELVETMIVSGQATSTLDALIQLAEAAAFDDRLAPVVNAIVEEVFGGADAVATLLVAFDHIVDSVGAGDTVTTSMSVVGIVSETVSFSDEVSASATLVEALRDSVPLFATLQVVDDVFSGFVMNTENRAVSEYSNYPFNSFGEMGGSYYGASPEGIYILEGDDDDGDPIEARVRTAVINLLRGKMARVPSAYVGYTSDGTVVLKVVVTSEQGAKEEYWYEMKPQNADAPREGRVKVGKGLKSVYWEFELVNKAGADFELENVQLYFVPLSRRI